MSPTGSILSSQRQPLLSVSLCFFLEIFYEFNSRTYTHIHTFWKHKRWHSKALFCTFLFFFCKQYISLWGWALKKSEKETASHCTLWLLFTCIFFNCNAYTQENVCIFLKFGMKILKISSKNLKKTNSRPFYVSILWHYFYLFLKNLL